MNFFHIYKYLYNKYQQFYFGELYAQKNRYCNIKVENISSDHGGFIGYSKSAKTFFISGGQGGTNYTKGFTLENNKSKQVFWEQDNKGEVGDKNAKYKIDGQIVSKVEYDEAYKKFGEITKNQD